MGRRNLDRIAITEWREVVATVADMQREGWEIISHCRSCGLSMAVDLDLVAWRSGARTVLWNRTARCRRIGCSGIVDFQAKTPRVNYYRPLKADDREPL